MTGPGRTQLLALAAVLLLLPMLLAWPLPQVFATEVLTHPEREAAAHIWGLWAGGHLGQPLLVQTSATGYPDGFSLVLVDPGQLPLYWLFGWISPAAGYNGLIWGNLVLAGVSGALLAHRQRASLPLGAALAMACPTLLASTAEGTTEDFAAPWVLLQLVLLLRLVDKPSTGRLLSFALAFAWTSWCGPYNAVWSAFVDGAIGVGLLLQRRWRPAGFAVAGAGLGGLLILPQLWSLGQRSPGLPGTSERAGLPEVFESASFRGGLHHGADLMDPLVPGLLTTGEGIVSHTAYLGLAAVLLAGWAVAQDRRLWPWLVGALLMSSLSLGPYLYFKGQVVEALGHIALGPAGFLMQALPPLARLTRWYRAGAVASFLLIVPLLELAKGARWRAPVIAVLILADLLFSAPLQWPLHHHPLPTALPPGGPLLEFPAFTTMTPPPGSWRDHSALSQTQHGRPIPGTFMEAPGREASAAIRHTQELALRGSLPASAIRKLRAQGWEALVVHPDLLPPHSGWERTLSCLGEPTLRADDAVLYSLEALESCTR